MKSRKKKEKGERKGGEGEGGGRRKGELFQSLVHFPVAHSSQDWARPQPGAWDSVEIAHLDGRNSGA